MKTAKTQKIENLPLSQGYRVGDHDRRPWGEYVVTAIGQAERRGEEFCEKIILVNPGKILSLQSHEFRRERWTVWQGTLTVVLDGERLVLGTGKTVDIPLGAIHCMANTGGKFCLVQERQEGMCREEDITRYIDSYGRGTQETDEGRVLASIDRYNEILTDLQQAV